jgi:WD40 repeat protein
MAARSLGAITIPGSHAAGVSSVRIAGDRRILSASLDGTLREWPGGRTLVRFPQVHLYAGSEPVQPYCLNLSVNEKYLICGMQHGTVQLFSPDGAPVRTLPNPIEKSAYQYNFHTVTAHPADPDIVAGSNGGYLAVWSARDGSIVWRETSFRSINCVRFLRGGQFLMAHEWDPWIHLWDFAERRRIRWDTELMETSANWVTGAVAPTGSTVDFLIAAEDADGAMLVGANLDRSEVGWLGRTKGRIHDLAFLPDGRHFLTGGDAGTLELWDMDSYDPSQELHLRSAPALAGRIGEASERGGGIILTAPVLDEDFYPPWTIHCLDVSRDGSFAVAGLANGLVLRIEIDLVGTAFSPSPAG